jgi:hypothetical protein
VGAVARAERIEERARKPQVRGRLRVVAQILAVRELRKALQEVSRTIDLAAARAEAIASLASSMDRSEEHESQFFCGDCNNGIDSCSCTPHGWDD